MSARTLVRGPIGRLAAVSLGSNIVDGIRVAAFTVLTTAYADSALEVALVATVATLPKAFLSIPIGVMLDRWSKLRTLYLVNLARALILAGLAVALYLGAGSILLLCAFAFFFGTLEEFYDAAGARAWQRSYRTVCWRHLGRMVHDNAIYFECGNIAHHCARTTLSSALALTDARPVFSRGKTRREQAGERVGRVRSESQQPTEGRNY